MGCTAQDDRSSTARPAGSADLFFRPFRQFRRSDRPASFPFQPRIFADGIPSAFIRGYIQSLRCSTTTEIPEEPEHQKTGERGRGLLPFASAPAALGILDFLWISSPFGFPLFPADMGVEEDLA
jgi:hypothetical protein